MTTIGMVLFTVLTIVFTLDYIRILKESLVKDYEQMKERCITSEEEEE